MNEIEKMAMTEENSIPMIDEKSVFSESRSSSRGSAEESSSESENELSDKANNSWTLC